MATVIQTEGKSTEGKPRRRRKRGSDRWLSEVKGIAALLAAGFGLIALTTFDPTLTPAEQQGLTGPVGGPARQAVGRSPVPATGGWGRGRRRP